VPIERYVVIDPGTSGSDQIEADVECPSCGQRRHVRLEAPPAHREVQANLADLDASSTLEDLA